jgi:hypothetical protein
MRERPKRPALRPPRVISRGFVEPRGANGLVDESVATVRKSLELTAKSL